MCDVTQPVALDPSPPRKQSPRRGDSADRSRDRRRDDDYNDRDRDRRGSRGGRDDRDRRSEYDDNGRDRDGRRERRWEDDRGGGRGGGGGGGQVGGRAGMPPPPPVSTEPMLYSVYRGSVSNSMEFGVFITLAQFGRKEGLLHISQITGKGRIMSGKDAFKRGEAVWVKVLSVNDNKMSLTMRDVDQATGEDLAPISATTGQSSNPDKPKEEAYSGITITDEDREIGSVRVSKRLADHDLWEAQQLIASGVLSVEDYPTYDEEHGMLGPNNADDNEPDLEIELNEEEPAFLQGQTKMSLNLSPIKVVKNPDGSLQRAALTQSALAKERRELKDQQQRAVMESAPKDLGRTWADPLAAPGERMLSQELAGIGSAPPEVEEWRTQTMDKGGTAVGYRQTSQTLKEQREGLPIFLFREAFLKSMEEHQVCEAEAVVLAVEVLMSE